MPQADQHDADAERDIDHVENDFQEAGDRAGSKRAHGWPRRMEWARSVTPSFAAGPFSRPACGSNQRAGGEDAPAGRGVKAPRLECMGDQGERGDGQSGQESEIAEGHREAIDHVEERVGAWSSSRVDCCGAAFRAVKLVFKASDRRPVVRYVQTHRFSIKEFIDKQY